MQYQAYGISEKGYVRAKNEDAIFLDTERHVFAVADGIGGMPHGEIASQAAMDSLRTLLDKNGSDDLSFKREIITQLNQSVNEAGMEKIKNGNIGTTFSMLTLIGTNAHLFHVGDSAIYRFRYGNPEKLTAAHNVEFEALSRGVPFDASGGYRYALTRYLGMRDAPIPQIDSFTLLKGDRFLICTDGVSDFVKPETLAAEIKSSIKPDKSLQQILQHCLEAGGHDNITAIALFIESID
jgi:serine/threonine protein phosphatase PrpC